MDKKLEKKLTKLTHFFGDLPLFYNVTIELGKPRESRNPFKSNSLKIPIVEHVEGDIPSMFSLFGNSNQTLGFARYDIKTEIFSVHLKKPIVGDVVLPAGIYEPIDLDEFVSREISKSCSITQ